MNSATEIILRWILDEQMKNLEASQRMPEETIDEFIQSIKEGVSLEEEDAIEVMNGLLVLAKQAPKDEPWNGVIEAAFQLHNELEDVTKAIHNLEQIKIISESLENAPTNALAKKITLMKIKECVSRLK